MMSNKGTQEGDIQKFHNYGPSRSPMDLLGLKSIFTEPQVIILVYYECIKRELKIRPIRELGSTVDSSVTVERTPNRLLVGSSDGAPADEKKTGKNPGFSKSGRRRRGRVIKDAS